MPQPRPHDDIAELWRRFQQRDRTALARLLTLAAQGDSRLAGSAPQLSTLNPQPPVIAITGSGGVGKSSLVGAICQHLAERGETVGVLACDPQSSITGGALLGDRCRIVGPSTADKVFVRSLATPAGQQGLAEHLDAMLAIMRASGFDWVLLETVGTGQGDTAVRARADVLVLVLQPQTGDSLQWEKAGLMEVADVVVVNKGDLPNADQTVADVAEQVRSPNRNDVPVVKTSVVRGEGITELWSAIGERRGVSPPCPALQSHGGLTPRRSPETDSPLTDIADYVARPANFSDEAYNTARLCLMDSLGCALLALNYPECTKLLGPIVPGATLSGGARVPGTAFELDPTQAAFNIGCLIRWLDYNDTWLAAEWGHPSDNFGGILATADWMCRRSEPGASATGVVATVRDVLTAAIKAYEIQGVLALENAFNRIGLDHVILVRVATTAVVTQLLGGTKQQLINAVSNAFLDGGSLRTYRHAPNAGSRKSWAAGDATRRGVQHALWSLAGEMGYPTALTAPRWGFLDVVLGGKPLIVNRPFDSYVMEHVLFKVSFPAEFHAQTAAEAAVALHPQVIGRLDDIERVEITTQESAVRIIAKTGPLTNPAARDHCLQYITAVAMIHGTVTSDLYEDAAAVDPRIDRLRDKMQVVEDPRYSRDYLDPDKRSIANSVQVFFKDGTSTPRIEVEYPLGHRRRRAESVQPLREKFLANATTRFGDKRAQELLALFANAAQLDEMPVDDFLARFVTARE